MTEPILNGYDLARLCSRWDQRLKAATSKSALREAITEYELDANARGMSSAKKNEGHAWLILQWRRFHKSGTPGRKSAKGRKVPNHD